MRSDSPSDQTAVLFDLDGTLIDTATDFITILNDLRLDQHLTPLPEQTIRNTVSGGAREMIKLAFGGAPGESEFDRLLDEFLRRYQVCISEGHTQARVFPQLDSIVRRLTESDLPWGVVTNKPLRFSSALLSSIDLSPPVLICPDHVAAPKPAPDALLLACDKLACQPHHGVYVGDHQRDIEAGRNDHMATVAVAWGYFEEADPIKAWRADFLACDGDHLLHILNSAPLRFELPIV